MRIKKIILSAVAVGVLLSNTMSFAEIVNGKILEVNVKYNFVVINMGENAKLKKGAQLLIYREKKLLGKVEVEEVFPDMSSCKVLPWFEKQEIKINDGVMKP